MNNWFKDLDMPGKSVVLALLYVSILASVVMFLLFSSSPAVGTAIKVLSLVLVAISLYIIFWIVKGKRTGEYRQVVMLLSAIAIGFTLMAFL